MDRLLRESQNSPYCLLTRVKTYCIVYWGSQNSQYDLQQGVETLDILVTAGPIDFSLKS